VVGSTVPTPCCNLGFFFHAVWNKGLLNIESLDEFLPGRVVEAENGLVFLDVSLSLLVNGIWGRRN